MTIYRKVSFRMWGDEKFRRLSPLQPSAQGLWLFLLTGPHTTALPGLSRVSEAALAEELGWPLEVFRSCFREVEAEGMARADWRAKLLWLPNGIRHNEPANPNQVVGWQPLWDTLPECKLKAEVFASWRDYFKERGKGFLKAFTTNFRPPQQNVSPNVLGNHAPNGVGTFVVTGSKSGTGTGTGAGTESGAEAVAAAEAGQPPPLHPRAKTTFGRNGHDGGKPAAAAFSIFFEWMNDERQRVFPGALPESAPMDFEGWYCTALAEVKGKEARLKAAWTAYLRDEGWARKRAPPCPVVGFIRNGTWRRHIPGQGNRPVVDRNLPRC